MSGGERRCGKRGRGAAGKTHAQHYLTRFGYRFDRRFQLDSIVERLAWAAVHTAPQPYRVVTADV